MRKNNLETKTKGKLCTACGKEIIYGRAMRISFGHFENETFTRNADNELYCVACARKERIARVKPPLTTKVIKIFAYRECPFCRGPMEHTLAIARPNPITEKWKDRSDYYECQHCHVLETVDSPRKYKFAEFMGD